jgi:drug/metabolite transporter (DMT)-like permease
MTTLGSGALIAPEVVVPPRSDMRAATVQGLAAIALWSALASLTTLAGAVPPFQLAAMTFTLSAILGLAYARLSGQSIRVLRDLPLAALALGTYGLLGYHACYFFALQTAPPLEASLVNYLWPLLIVLFSGLLPARYGGKRLSAWHIAGAAVGFGGTLVLLTGAAGKPEFSGSIGGYAFALAAALIWSSYSVGSRLFARVPSLSVMASCAATAAGAALLHLAFEPTVWPATAAAWAGVLALGIGPVGLAFYLWDAGMKHGDIRLLGGASYMAPLLSTLLMAGLGLGRADASVWLAALLISAGALLASRDAWGR